MWPFTAKGMRDPDSLAIAVDVVGRTEPPDKHAAARDLEGANGELHRRVDSKLVLFKCVGETRRALRGGVESAWRNLVIQITRCNRQKPCCPNRDVHLGNRYVSLRRSKTRRGLQRRGRVQERPRRESPQARTTSHVHRLASSKAGGSTSWAAHGAPTDNRADHQNSWHKMPGKCCESLHTISTNVIEATSLRNLVMRSVPSRVGRWQRRCRRAMPREQARIARVSSAVAAQSSVCFRAVRAITRGRCAGTLGVGCA